MWTLFSSTCRSMITCMVNRQFPNGDKSVGVFSGSCSNSTHIHCTMLHKNNVLNYTIPCNMCITSNSNTVLKGDLSYQLSQISFFLVFSTPSLIFFYHLKYTIIMFIVEDLLSKKIMILINKIYNSNQSCAKTIISNDATCNSPGFCCCCFFLIQVMHNCLFSTQNILFVRLLYNWSHEQLYISRVIKHDSAI